MRLPAGHAVDRYTVERLLGEGGMAEVYLVRHNTLNSPHALKVLTHAGPAVHTRLIQEGRVQANLRHPNIVAVTDVLDVDGAPALVMEFVEGHALDEWLRQHEPTLEQALYIFRAILDGVERAHAVGVAHRDLKPANVMISDLGVPKVTDFGLAKALQTGQPGHTRTGSAMGTPAYMAPEQIRNAKDADTRADIFALGCILYELCCGQQAFDAPDLLSLFNKVASGDTLDPLEVKPDLPEPVVMAIRGAMAVQREARIQDVATLRAVLNGERAWVRQPSAPTLSLDDIDLPEPESAASPAPKREKRFPWGRVAIGLGLALVGLGALGAAATGALGIAVLGAKNKPSPTVPATVQPRPEPARAPAPAPVSSPQPSDEPEREVPSEPPALKPPSKAPVSLEPSDPEPVVDPPAEPQPELQPEPQPATGRVTMSGADSVLLTGPAGRFGPGDVPPGTYDVTASWDGHASGAGTITVAAGQTLRLRCDQDFLVCEAR